MYRKYKQVQYGVEDEDEAHSKLYPSSVYR